jgi:membrane-associated phospholipid phosphatase
MNFKLSHTPRRAALAAVFVFTVSLCASAQNVEPAQTTATPTASPTVPPATSPTASPAASPTPRAGARPSLEREFVKNIFRDQRAIWTAPFHLNHGDARWLLPVTLSSVALFATDRHTAGAIDEDDHLAISHDISLVGSVYGVGSIAAGFYLVGRATHNARARETGLLGGEALIDGGIVSLALKNVSRRQRPRTDNASGEFFSGGNSFPSGHSIAAWSLATVVAEEYHERRAVQIAAYGLAAAVGFSRYTGRNHFLSDVLVGSAIGYGVGRYVYHTHHDAALDTDNDDSASLRTRSKLFPRISPDYDRRAHEYGVGLAWSF